MRLVISDPFKILVESEISKIFPKLHSKTTSGVYMNLWLKSEVSFEIFGRIFSGNNLSIILDRSMFSNFQISRSAEWSLSSLQDDSRSRGWDLSDLFRFLFRSLIWIVVDFPGEIRCVLWDIPWTIYRHILSSISDRSLISKSSEFMITFIISERFYRFCWEQRPRRSVLTLLGYTICRVDIFPCEIRGLGISSTTFVGWSPYSVRDVRQIDDVEFSKFMINSKTFEIPSGHLVSSETDSLMIRCKIRLVQWSRDWLI